MRENFEYDFAEINGKIEMNDFLDNLDYLDRAKIITYFDKLVEYLTINPYPTQKLSKHLKEGIFELKVHLRNNISRSFFFFEIDKLIIFTHSFIKKTDKTPFKEIEKAIRIREIWRKEHE
jgi:phage-related protein